MLGVQYPEILRFSDQRRSDVRHHGLLLLDESCNLSHRSYGRSVQMLHEPERHHVLPSSLCAGASFFGAVPVPHTKIQIFKPASFGGPTAQIESPRRALAIRAAEGEIEEGLHQNDAKVAVGWV